MAGLRLITPPNVEPISLPEAMAHLRVTDLNEQGSLELYIRNAREHLDGALGSLMGEAMLTQTWEYILHAFPTTSCIPIPLRPLAGVTQIAYDDASGVEQIMPPANYVVDTASLVGQVVLAPGSSWPATINRINAVRIRFTAGYGSTPADIPGYYRQALLLLLGHFYEHRGDTATLEPDFSPAFYALLGVKGRLT
jgi:uncharacterized phiE125 gp8 family phage protein